MKKLIITTVVSISVLEGFSALPKWKDGDPNVIVTNNVEYTKRGSMGTKDYVATDVATSNLMQRGYNTMGCEELDDEESRYDDIPYDVWGSAETEIDAQGKLKVKFPARRNDGSFVYEGGQKVYVPKGMQLGEGGFQLLDTQNGTDIHTFSYTALGDKKHMTNLPFIYGTNKVYEVGAPKLELPRKNDGSTIQNSNLIFADRAWFTNFIIKAGIKTEQEVKTILDSMN